MSIDIDGMDYFVFESLHAHFPKVIVVEFNPSIPNDVIFVQARNPNVHQGCSLTAIVELGKLKGYELICATTTNAILVRSEFYSRFGLQNNHPMMLFKPTMDGRIFHGYDSTVFSIGMPHLIWSGFAIDHMDIQVLPLSARRYGGAVDN